jgi:hypothetical protein
MERIASLTQGLIHSSHPVEELDKVATIHCPVLS